MTHTITTDKRFVLHTKTPVTDTLIAHESAIVLIDQLFGMAYQYAALDASITDSTTGEVYVSCLNKDEGGVSIYFCKEFKDWLLGHMGTSIHSN